MPSLSIGTRMLAMKIDHRERPVAVVPEEHDAAHDGVVLASRTATTCASRHRFAGM